MTLRRDTARGIGGVLDWQRLHFNVLEEPEKAAAIRRLSVAGYSLHTISEATGLTLAEVERVLEGEVAP
jgi:hypothetical protein